jgi:hypothetical protein
MRRRFTEPSAMVRITAAEARANSYEARSRNFK